MMSDLESIKAWIAPCANMPPCGDAIEYDAQFMALEQLAAGKPEVQYGDTIIPSEAADWRGVRDSAQQLLEQSKDIRLAAYLARATAALDGLEGLARPLDFMHYALQEWWEQVHPQIVIDGESDPMIRANAIAEISDNAGFLKSVRDCALIDRHGVKVTVRDAEVALGLQPGETTGVSSVQFESILRELLPENPELLSPFHNCAKRIVAIDALCKERLGSEDSPDLVAALRLFQGLSAALSKLSNTVFGSEAGDSSDTGALSLAGNSSAGSVIKSRADAVRAMDAICVYFQHNEPNSPVPILISRARKMVGMSFMEIMRDMAPDSMQRLGIIAGTLPDEA